MPDELRALGRATIDLGKAVLRLALSLVSLALTVGVITWVLVLTNVVVADSAVWFAAGLLVLVVALGLLGFRHGTRFGEARQRDRLAGRD